MFGAPPAAFGAYTVDAAMGEGRFGPLFRAHAADGAPVVVRVFAQRFTDEQRDRFLAQLASLCDRPLDHPSIARPLAFGQQGGRPYLVHSYLPGTSLDDRQAIAGLSPALLTLRLTYLAGALDFAAAVGVLHGALRPADVILSDDNAGVSGFGLMQALEAAGVEGFHADRQDDIAALMSLARDLMGARATPAARAVLAAPAPASALEFAAALQGAIQPELPATPTFDFESESAAVDEAEAFRAFDSERTEAVTPDQSTPGAASFDIPLRHETPLNAGSAPVVEPEPQPAAATAVPFIDEDIPPPGPSLTYEPVIERQPVAAAPMLFGTADEDVSGMGAGRPRRSGRSWLLVGAAALAVGVLAGFFVAREMPSSRPAPSAATPPPPQPEATNGRTFTDASVDEAAKPNQAPPAATSAGSTPGANAPAAVAPAPNTNAPAPAAPVPDQRPAASEPPRVASPATPPRSTSRAAAPASRTGRAAAAPEPSGPAAMRVDSLPAGAQVFVDGRSVGYTPMVVGDLTPGTHSIRLQLPGYRPWVSAVTLGPGARERLSASLEQ